MCNFGKLKLHTMKHLLYSLGILFSVTSFAQNWEDLGPQNAFGNTNDMQIAVADDGTPHVAVIDQSNMVQVYFWDWQQEQWQQMFNPFVEASTNIQLIAHGDTLYVGFSSVSNNYEVHSFLSSTPTFTPLNISDLTAIPITLEPNSAQLSVNPDSHKPMLTVYRPDIQEDDMDVYVWDGANWNMHGNPGFCYWSDPDVANIRAVSNGQYSYVLANQFDMGGASIGAPSTTDKPQQANNNKAGGSPELGLYRIDELAPSSWDAVTGSYLPGTDDPEKMEMACNPGKEPVVIFNTWTNQFTMQMFRGNGLGAPVYETPFGAPSPINILDIQMMNNDSAIVFYQHDPQMPENSHVMIEDGGGFVEVGAPGVSQIQFQDAQMDISIYTNKPYVLWWDGTETGVRVFNQPPSFNSNTPANNVCQDASTFVAIDEIIFDDPDHDQLHVWVVSNTPAILQTSNIVVGNSQPFNPSTASSHFSIGVTTEAGQTGTVDIDIFCSDGIDTIMTSASFDVYPLPTADIILPSNDLCLNAGTKVLDAYGTPPGGNFGGTGVNNNKYHPDIAGVGNHNLHYVYQDANGCKDTVTEVINVLDIPQISFAITPATCGDDDGAVDATITGGAPGYTIYWSNGSNTEDINNLDASMYYINVTDQNDCYVMDVATVSAAGLSLSGTKINVSCPGGNDGSIDMTVGGVGPFQYSWSNGFIGEDPSNLSAGQYEVFVTDGGGCEGMFSVNITEPDMIMADFNVMEATCGVADGGINAIVSGGTAPYNYQWYDDTFTPFGPNSNTVSSLAAGYYQLGVMDNNGCTAFFNGTLPEAGGPTIIPMNIQEATCADDGAVDITINALNGIQGIMWSNGATTEDVSGLAPGYYSVQVMDIYGCIGMAGFDVNPELPIADEICVVTVDSATSTNLIVWEKPVTSEISHWNLYRESSVAGVYQFVDSILYSEDSEYNDTIAYPNLRSWRYELTTVNNCGVESNPSLSHKTIHLTISQGLPGSYNLHWDEYEGFNYPTYFIYRHTQQTGWVEIAQIAYGTGNSLTDPPPSGLELDYIISIDPPQTCTSSQNKAQDYNSSRSNNIESYGGLPDDSGIEENAFGLTIYPNPSTGLFFLEFEEYHNYDISVFDLSGKLVFNKNVNAIKYKVDLSDLASGSYTIKITNEEASVVQKLIIE